MKILYLPNQYSQQRQREKPACIYPILLAMEATYYKNKGETIIWGDRLAFPHDKIITESEGIDFLKLPPPDRILTRAMDYAYNNGNFKYLPGTYIMAANGCWHGECIFCVEKNSHYQVRDVDSVIEEIKECKQMGFREVFDDSGTFPTGRWLNEFIAKVKGIGIKIGCNFRMVDADYSRMADAGFRMLLFGVESANQDTLNRIQKGVRFEDIKYIIKAAEAGLEPHIAVMFGYPWETEADSINTLRLVHYLLRKGYAKTAQASFYTTNEASNNSQRKYVRMIYNIAYSPEFWFNKIKDIHNVDDLKYLWRAIKKGLAR